MDIVKEMRSFEIDHEPDGWPAIQMKQVSALCDEIERLNAEREQLLAQEPAIKAVFTSDGRIIQWEWFDEKSGSAAIDLVAAKYGKKVTNLYTQAIPAQPSPAVAMSDSDDGLLPIDKHDHPESRVMYWGEQELRAIKDYAKRCIAAVPSPRITEQDAREIAEAYAEYPHSFSSWLKFEGRALLNKLNAKPESVGG